MVDIRWRTIIIAYISLVRIVYRKYRKNQYLRNIKADILFYARIAYRIAANGKKV